MFCSAAIMYSRIQHLTPYALPGSVTPPLLESHYAHRPFIPLSTADKYSLSLSLSRLIDPLITTRRIQESTHPPPPPPCYIPASSPACSRRVFLAPSSFLKMARADPVALFLAAVVVVVGMLGAVSSLEVTSPSSELVAVAER